MPDNENLLVERYPAKLFLVGAKKQSVAEDARAVREHPRYAHESAVTLHLGSKTLAGRTINVSGGGLCAEVADPIKGGTEMVIDLLLVFDDRSASETMRIQARVAWCTTVDESFQIGLAFRPIDGVQAQEIAAFVRHLDDSTGGSPRLPKPKPSIDDRFG